MRLAGAVVAGGKSTRMGVDKARLRLEGRGLALRHLDAMDRCGFEPLILNAYTAPGELPGWVALIPDDHPGQGPLEGLASILRRVDRPVLVAAADMPGLDAEAFRALASAYALAPGPGLVARAADGWHPLFAVYSPALLPALEAALARGERAMHAFIEAAALPAWAGAQGAWLANLNTPAERSAWQAEHGKLEDP
jgi:molybdenum cofactor guanylyltransferase